jgi:tRNA pseudouridine55 synthase
MASLDGLINLHKPLGMTSAKAVYKARALTGQRKIGHAGTLDPSAEGVLLLCLGKGTKLVERLMNLPKVYRAVARLDATSPTLDSEGPVDEVPVSRVPSPEEVAGALRGFEGEQQQVPPAISALKVGGIPAYRLARRGEAPELAARTIRIYWVHLHEFRWPTVDFSMACGRGTYVRAVARDLGRKLGTGGCLTALQRLGVGPFTIEEACSLERLATPDGSGCILSLAAVEERLGRGQGWIPPRPV